MRKKNNYNTILIKNVVFMLTHMTNILNIVKNKTKNVFLYKLSILQKYQYKQT